MTGCPDCDRLTGGDCGKHGPTIFGLSPTSVPQLACPTCAVLREALEQERGIRFASERFRKEDAFEHINEQIAHVKERDDLEAALMEARAEIIRLTQALTAPWNQSHPDYGADHPSFCNAEHKDTGAVCKLIEGHEQNHRGQFDNGIAQWPRGESKSQTQEP